MRRFRPIKRHLSIELYIILGPFLDGNVTANVMIAIRLGSRQDVTRSLKIRAADETKI